jgi:hypothetical protein
VRRFTTRWIPLREASAFVAKHHRHNAPPKGAIVAVGLFEAERLVGVGILGRPVSRVFQAAGDAELIRLCVMPGVEHAASALQGRVRRVAQSLGFRRMITYTLKEEGGVSMRAAGMQLEIGLSRGGSWSTPTRERPEPNYPLARKIRWWAPLRSQGEIEL